MNRRDFLRHAAAAMAAAAGGCITAEGTREKTGTTRGVVVSARDLSGAFDWPRLAHEAGLTTVATHIGPRDVMPFMMSGRGARFLDACARYGIQVEHELHAIDWLLPRTMFATDPSFFRMNAKGERTPDSNCCPSNPFALEVIAGRAVEAARVCRSTTGRYFYWMTDNGEKCNCPKCKPLSGAEQAVIVENAIVRALRVEIDPNATLAHLAYQFTMDPPRLVKPDPHLFLEFAPIERWHAKGVQRREPLAEDGPWLEKLDRLLTVFPAATAQALEYWLDASLFSKWRKPLARIPWDAAKTRDEIAAYRKRGIRHFTTFAVYVDDDYVNVFGPAALDCVREYGQLLRS